MHPLSHSKRLRRAENWTSVSPWWTVRYPDHAGDVIVSAAHVPRIAWGAAGRGVHSFTFQLNLIRFGHPFPCPPVQ